MSAENDSEKARLSTDNETKMPPNEADPPVASDAAAKMDPETEPLNAASDPKVKFTGGSEMVDVEKGGETKQNLSPALTKAELMKYANDPFWVKLRWALFGLFWAAWLAMLVGAIVIIYYAEKCPSPPAKQWWQKKPIYEVYVKSFKDSNGDGKGDLKGVQEKLDYLSGLGIGSIYLSPIYTSPMKDNGFDVSDYKNINEEFGTMEDFKALVAAIHEKGMKLIMDFIPNDTSDQHPWFEKSINKEDPYTDYYIWADGKNGGPPNNWRSIFGNKESAWTKNNKRGQYYLHHFYKEQPELNLRNENVVNELTKILKFWIDLGVDGFRVDSVGSFFEDENLADEDDFNTKPKTYNLPEVLDLLKKFRKVLDDETAKDVENPKIMMTEAYLTTSKLIQYYGTVDNETGIGNIAQLPLNFNLLTDLKKVDANGLKNTITKYIDGLSEHKSPNKKYDSWPNFCIGNHDHQRVASRLGSENVDIMNMITLMLPGTPFTYYGEEIGMIDGTTGLDREQYITPMQWSNDPNAGFSSADPWIAVNPDYNSGVNVAELDSNENSHIHVYREVASLREDKAILYGSTNITVKETVFAMARIRKGNPGYLLISNFGTEEITMNLKDVPNIAERGTLTLGLPKDEALPVGSNMLLTELVMPPGKTYLITFVPSF